MKNGTDIKFEFGYIGPGPRKLDPGWRIRDGGYICWKVRCGTEYECESDDKIRKNGTTRCKHCGQFISKRPKNQTLMEVFKPDFKQLGDDRAEWHKF